MEDDHGQDAGELQRHGDTDGGHDGARNPRGQDGRGSGEDGREDSGVGNQGSADGDSVSPRLSPEALAERLKLPPVEAEAKSLQPMMSIAWLCDCGHRAGTNDPEALANVGMGARMLMRCKGCGDSILVGNKPKPRIVRPGDPVNRHERRTLIAMGKR